VSDREIALAVVRGLRRDLGRLTVPAAPSQTLSPERKTARLEMQNLRFAIEASIDALEALAAREPEDEQDEWDISAEWGVTHNAIALNMARLRALCVAERARLRSAESGRRGSSTRQANAREWEVRLRPEIERLLRARQKIEYIGAVLCDETTPGSDQIKRFVRKVKKGLNAKKIV